MTFNSNSSIENFETFPTTEVGIKKNKDEIYEESKTLFKIIESSDTNVLDYYDFFSTSKNNNFLIKENKYFLINKDWLSRFKNFCQSKDYFKDYVSLEQINNNNLIIQDSNVLKNKNDPIYFNNKYDIHKNCSFIKKDLWEKLIKLYEGGPEYEIIYYNDKNINLIKEGVHINLLIIPNKNQIIDNINKNKNNFIIKKYIYFDLNKKVKDLKNYINKILNYYKKKLFSSIDKKEILEENNHYRLWLYATFFESSNGLDNLSNYLAKELINSYKKSKKDKNNSNNFIDWSKFNKFFDQDFKICLLSNFEDNKVKDIFPNENTTNFNWKNYEKMKYKDQYSLPEFSIIIEKSQFQLKKENKMYKIGECNRCNYSEIVYYACDCKSLFFCCQNCENNYKEKDNSHFSKCKNYLIKYFKKENKELSTNKHLIYPLIGLSNLGNSCYMNSALQCMRSIKELTIYFLKYFDEQQLNTHNIIGTGGFLTLAYANLIYNLNNSQKDYYSPEYFKNTIGIIDERYAGYEQQDTHELMTFLIDSIHEDLNKVINKPKINRKDSEINNYFSLELEHSKSTIEWNNFLKRNQSIMVDLFYGQYKATISCTYCQNKSINFSTYLSLQLPIPKYKEYFLVKIFFYEDVLKNFPMIKINIIMNKQNKKISNAKKIIGKIFGIEAYSLEILQNKSKEIIKIYNDDEEIDEKVNFLLVVKMNSKLLEENINCKNEINYSNLKENFTNKKNELIKIFENNGEDNSDETNNHNFDKNNNKIIYKKLSLEKFIVKHYYLYDSKISTDIFNKDILIYLKLNQTCYDIYYKIYELYFEIIIRKHLGELNNINNEKNQLKSFEYFFIDFIEKENEFTNDIFDKYKNLPFVLKFEDNSNINKIEFIPPFKKYIFKDFLNLKYHNNLNNENKKDNLNFDNNLSFSNSKAMNVININNDNNIQKSPSPIQTYNEGDKIDDNPIDYQNNNNRNIDNGNNDLYHLNNLNDSLSNKTKDLNTNDAFNLSKDKSISICIEKDKDDKLEESKNNIKKIIMIWNPKFLKKKDGNNYDSLIMASDNIDLCSFFLKIYENNFEKILFKKCLEEFSKEETFDKDNLWKCSKCHQNIAAKNKIEIYQIPKILIIQLKRFENNQKIESFIDFPLKNLDISQFVTSSISQKDGIPKKYDLFAVANHYGRMEYGHYDAFCLNYIDNNWYNFNDRHVEKIKKEDEINSIVTKNAYVLFYRQQKNDLIDWDAIYIKKFSEIEDNKMKKYGEDFIYKNEHDEDFEKRKKINPDNNNKDEMEIEENVDNISFDDLSLGKFVYNPFSQSYLKLKRRLIRK